MRGGARAVWDPEGGGHDAHPGSNQRRPQHPPEYQPGLRDQVRNQSQNFFTQQLAVSELHCWLVIVCTSLDAKEPPAAHPRLEGQRLGCDRTSRFGTVRLL